MGGISLVVTCFFQGGGKFAAPPSIKNSSQFGGRVKKSGRGKFIVPDELGWIIQRRGSDPTSRSLREGKRGELEAAKVLKKLGIDAKRSAQYCGHHGTGDLTVDCPIHFEVKRQERLNVYEAINQAVRDSCGKVPAVLWRRNRCDWILILRVDDVLRFVKAMMKRETETP